VGISRTKSDEDVSKSAKCDLLKEDEPTIAQFLERGSANRTLPDKRRHRRC
jgi:hypothetical protein